MFATDTETSAGTPFVRMMPAVFLLIWSSGFVVARYAMPYAPPIRFLTVRFALCVACLGLWAVASRAVWPSGRRQWLHLAVTGLLMQAGYLGGIWTAVKLGMGAGLSALLVSLQPVLTAIWLSRRGSAVTRRQATGLGVGLVGLLLVVWAKLGLGEVTAANLGFALLALLAITTGTLYQKRFLAPCDVRTANLVQIAAAFVVLLPLALLEQEPIRWYDAGGNLNHELAGAMIWSVLGLTLGGSSLLYLMIQRGAATTVTSLLYLVPPTTAIMAWILFGEPIRTLTLVGTVLAALGVAMVVRQRN